MKYRFSLRLRTLVFITLLIAFSVGASVSAMKWVSHDTLIEQVDNDIRLLARVLASSLAMSGQLPQQVDAVINQGMKATALALSQYIAAAGKANESPAAVHKGLQHILDNSMVGEIWVTDSQGRPYLNASDQPLRFNAESNTPPQAPAFATLLQGQVGVITQPMQKRDSDGLLYKYVGVSGVDKPRIVQVGVKGQDIQNLINEISLQKFTNLVVDQGLLKSLHVVNTDLTPMLLEYSRSTQSDKLSTEQKQRIAKAMQLESMDIQIQPDGIEVYRRLENEKKEVIGGFVLKIPRDTLDKLMTKQWHTALSVGLMVFIAGGWLGLLMTDRIAKPINDIALAAAQIKRGNFEKLDRLHPASQRKDEIGKLAQVFHDMAHIVRERERKLDGLVADRTLELADKNKALETAQREIDHELNLARKLQLAILPDQFPDNNLCTGHARMLPATQVGGDFYDFIELDNGQIALVVADVSGKGMSAAFFMAVARTSINSLIRLHADPGQCLLLANNELCRQNPMDMFVTVFLGIYDPQTGQLHYANAGHNPPLWRESNGTVHALPFTDGMALGVLADIEFPSHKIHLQPGDLLLAYSDGVTEAFNPALEEFGEIRLKQLLNRPLDSNATLVQTIFDEVALFAAGAAQSDDITVAALRRSA
jgi:sigma-B regulation protein RsbU (phosphoserine phosphatase)